MSNLPEKEKLHYQMLRRVMSGTSEEALAQLIEKAGSLSGKTGEPVAIYYSGGTNTEEGGGVMLAVANPKGSGDSYVFLNKRQIEDRFEETELVTAEALCDLDDRISGLTNTIKELSATTKGDMSAMTVTEDVTALGVSAGAIAKGDTVKSGSTLTEFVKQLLIQVKDPTPVKPTLAIGPALDKTIEVGTVVDVNITPTATTGSFTASTADGFSYTSKTANATGDTVTYTYAGTSKTGSTTGDTEITFTASTDTSYSIGATMDYAESTAVSVGATCNNGTDSSVKIDAGTATATSLTTTAKYKYYYGFVDALTVDDPKDLTPDDLSNVTSGWMNTQGDTVIITGQTGTNKIQYNGKRLVVIVYGTLKNAIDASNGSVDYSKSADMVHDTSTIAIGGTSTASYNVYLHKVQNGNAIALQTLVITHK